MLDALPLLSEPTSRAFTGERPVPSVFFFVTLFAHIGIPLGMGVVFWLHVKRLERPVLLPPRPLLWATIGLLAGVAVVRPLGMAAKANPFVLPAEIPTDVFFAFWVPAVRSVRGGIALSCVTLVAVVLVLLPVVTARRGGSRAAPSTVDEEICTGCTQCSLDCPYGAIQMIERSSRRSTQVARVDPDLCVSCGICAGSCAPMGVGPPGRTGRDQVAGVQAFVYASERNAGEVVAICCDHGAAAHGPALAAAGAAVYPIDCAGNLHTSVIEILLRGGAGGVLVLACPPRDCRNREGPRWLLERVYHEREAELQARVDRARVRIAHVNAAERDQAIAILRAFSADVSILHAPAVDRAVSFEAACESAAVGSRS